MKKKSPIPPPQIRRDVFGWRVDTSEKPAHDPGMDGICPFCSKKLSLPIKIISLMPYDVRIFSFFYRAHADCYENATDREKMLVDSSCIDVVVESLGTEKTPDTIAMPVVGELWQCNGYDFRIDHVSESEVYMVRFAEHEEIGRPMRIDKSLWVSDMSHAVKIRSA